MKIGILGCGAYGLALSTMFHENDCEITMWSKLDDEVNNLNKNRKSEILNIDIPKDIIFTTNLKETVTNKDLIVIAVPAKFVSDVSKKMSKYINRDQHICIASKGIENNTCLFISEIIEKYIKSRNICVISGPTFAIDMVNKIPVGLSLASKSKKTRELVISCLENKHLKLMETNDVIGCEICGAVKNVIAIASGILSGMGLPESTSAMFITEALHDISELIKGLGGNGKTILSYAGFGDLLLTCTSTKSRNFTFGHMIGEKKSKDEIDIYIKNTTIEGLYTLKSIHKLIKNKKVDIPIIDLIHDIVFYGKDVNELKYFLTNKKNSI